MLKLPPSKLTGIAGQTMVPNHVDLAHAAAWAKLMPRVEAAITVLATPPD